MRALNATTASRVLAGLLCAGAAAAVVVACLSGFRLHGLLINADAVYLPTLFRDLFELHGRWRAWYLTPAPYIFPDYLLFLPAYLLDRSAFHQVVIYALLQLGLTGLLVWLLARRMGCRAAYWPALLVTAVIAYLAIAHGQPYVFALMSAFHYSVFMFALWLAAQLVLAAPGGELPEGKSLWVACGLAFLVALSDALVMVQLLCPLVAWMVLRGWTRELDWRRSWRWTILPLLAGAAGTFSYRFIVPNGTRPASSLDLHMVGPKLRLGWELIRAEFVDSPVLMWGLAAFYLFAVYCLVVQLLRRPGRAPLPVSTLSSLAFISTAANLVATMALGSVEVTPRYFIGPACWPIVIAAVWLGLAMPRRPWLLAVPAALAVLGLAMSAAAGVERFGFQRDFYPQDIACIDAALEGTGLQNGLTHYWEAKRLSAFSHHDLRLAQYTNELGEFRWITSGRNYREAYDFALVTDEVASVMHHVSRETLLAAAGPPQRTVACAGHNLLIYGRGGLRLKPPVAP